jgi:hypothetical protein
MLTGQSSKWRRYLCGRDGLDVVGLSLILVGVALVWLLRWFILAAAAAAATVTVGLLVWIVRGYRADVARTRATDAAISAWANQQDHWLMAGDQRGTYGQFPPAML